MEVMVPGLGSRLGSGYRDVIFPSSPRACGSLFGRLWQLPQCCRRNDGSRPRVSEGHLTRVMDNSSPKPATPAMYSSSDMSSISIMVMRSENTYRNNADARGSGRRGAYPSSDRLDGVCYRHRRLVASPAPRDTLRGPSHRSVQRGSRMTGCARGICNTSDALAIGRSEP